MKKLNIPKLIGLIPIIGFIFAFVVFFESLPISDKMEVENRYWWYVPYQFLISCGIVCVFL